MVPFFLYLLTALITGFHIYSLLTLGLYGGAVNGLELIAFAGSLTLFVAAYVSLFRPYVAARIALIAALALWAFYAPAIATLVRSRTNHQTHKSQSSLPATSAMHIARELA